MKSYYLKNIHNQGSKIYLFCRGLDGKLDIIEDNSFTPYYYEKNPKYGAYTSIFGDKLDRIDCKHPKEVKEKRSSSAWESDILFTKRYIIDKIEKFEKSPNRWMMFDIEVETSELPRPKETKSADYPISCITTYDNFTKEYRQFFISDYNSPYELIQAFISYVKQNPIDILLAWNIEFDYLYLYYSYPDFVKEISPIGQLRYGMDDVPFPAGISVIDYLGSYHKYTLGKKDSYALDNVAQEELGYESFGETDFTDINKAKEKNLLDVKKMVELEDKHKIIDYFDEIRILSTCVWEDLPPLKNGYTYFSNNSKPIDMLMLREAKKLGRVLPSKQNDLEKEDIDGAYREIFQKGVFLDVLKADLTSAYPSVIVDFNLDPSTCFETPIENAIKVDLRSRETNEGTCTYYFKQNQGAILPSITKKLLTIKDSLKAELKTLDPTSHEYQNREFRYAAIKSLVNSIYGVSNNRFTRLYDKRVGETNTFLVRDLLHYVKDKIVLDGYKLIYLDTDGAFFLTREDIIEKLNDYIYMWGIDNYGIESSIKFEKEGVFTRLFLLKLCRYIGDLETKKGIKREIKGLQMKRKDSSIFIKKFQEELFEKILDNQNKEAIIVWIEEQIKSIETKNPLEIAFPCKINKPKSEYKKKEIYISAIENTAKLIKDFDKKIADKFWWIYTSVGPMAIDEKNLDLIYLRGHLKLDLIKMWERSIFNIALPIFEGMNWGIDFLQLAEKYNQKLELATRRDIVDVYKQDSRYLEFREKYKIKDKKERKKCSI